MNFPSLQLAQAEYDLMARLGNDLYPQRIQNFIDYFEDHSYIIQVQPLMEDDMRSHLTKKRAPMPECMVRYIFYQMAQAVHSCHSSGVIHRDVKLDNFLVKTADCLGNDDMRVKLTDFGLACRYDESEPPTEVCGSVPYVTPEQILQGGHDFKVDCWALGIILFELFDKGHPFYEEDKQQETLRNILHQPLDEREIWNWPGISAQAKDLVIKLLQKNPNDRLSSAEILEHPWFLVDLFPQKIVNKRQEPKVNTPKREQNLDDALFIDKTEEGYDIEDHTSQSVNGNSVQYSDVASSKMSTQASTYHTVVMRSQKKKQGFINPKQFVNEQNQILKHQKKIQKQPSSSLKKFQIKRRHVKKKRSKSLQKKY